MAPPPAAEPATAPAEVEVRDDASDGESADEGEDGGRRTRESHDGAEGEHAARRRLRSKDSIDGDTAEDPSAAGSGGAALVSPATKEKRKLTAEERQALRKQRAVREEKERLAAAAEAEAAAKAVVDQNGLYLYPELSQFAAACAVSEPIPEEMTKWEHVFQVRISPDLLRSPQIPRPPPTPLLPRPSLTFP